MTLPSATGSTAAKAAAAEAAAAETSTGAAAEATAASEDEGREPVVVITAAPVFLLRMIPAQFGQQQHNKLTDRITKAGQQDDKNRQPRVVILVGADLIPVNDGLTRLELTVERLRRRADSSIDVIDLHISDDALLSNVVALHIGQITFKSLARRNEIATVADS